MITAILILISLQCAVCVQMIDSQWVSTECVGPPQVMYVFEMVDIEEISPLVHEETWPEAFSNILKYEEVLYMCGVYQDIPNSGCCRIAYPEVDVGYMGIIAEPINLVTRSKSIPLSANGQRYCHVKASDETSLLGFQEMYILNSQCVSGITCNEKWIGLHDTGDCEDSNELVRYTFNTNNVNTTIGDFSASVGTVKGSLTVKFSSHFPSSMQYGRLSSPWEIFYLVTCIVCHIMILYTLKLSFQTYRLKKRRSDLMTFLCLLVILIDVEVIALNFYLRFADLNAYSEFWQFAALVDAVTTFFLVFHTAGVIIQSFGLSTVSARLLYLAIILTHTAFNGGVYIAYYYSMAIEPYYSIYLAWYGVGGPLWYVCMICFDATPIVYLVFSLIRSNARAGQKPLLEEIYRVVRRDTQIIWFILLNLAVTILYVWSQLAMLNFPIIFGQDINVMANSSFQMLLLTVHGVSQCLALEYVRKIWKHKAAFLGTTKQDPSWKSSIATGPSFNVDSGGKGSSGKAQVALIATNELATVLTPQKK